MTVRTRRSGATALATAVAAVMISGCAVGTGGRAASPDAAEFDASRALSGDLDVMGFSGVDEVATSRVDLAKEALGGVEVRLSEGELDLQQFLSAIAAGSPPDLVYANRNQIGSLAARGAIVPLDDCIAGEGIDTQQYVPAALALFFLGQKQIIQGVSTSGLKG